MKLSDFSFEALGKSMDKDLRDFRHTLGLSSRADSDERGEPTEPTEPKQITMGDIVRDLLKRVGKDVEMHSIDSNFEYNDLLNWVRANAIGNRMYVVKAKLENSSDNVLCVFFSKDNELLIGKSNPKVCYVYKELNPSIEDLFGTDKYVYVKPIKIV